MKTSKSLLIEGITREELRSDLRQQVRAIIQEEFYHQTKAPPDSKLDLLTLEETADIFKISRRSLFNWTKNKILPKVCIGRRIYYRREAVENLITKNELKH